MSRLAATFARLKVEGRAGLVTYVMAGDPDAAVADAILAGLPGAGADIIELGFPFSDPMAEGVSIQHASQRSLAGGTRLADVLATVARFRAGDATTPVVLMGYLNPIESLGLDRFARDAGPAGVDGLIVVDCPPEEADPLADALDRVGISLIRLATPTTDAARLPVVIRRTSGFVYYVSVAGVTGTKAADASAVAPQVERIRAASGLPVAVGFGIRTPDQAAAVARVADAVVVGSALVDRVATAIAANQSPIRAVLDSVAALSVAVRTARQTVEA